MVLQKNNILTVQNGWYLMQYNIEIKKTQVKIFKNMIFFFLDIFEIEIQ